VAGDLPEAVTPIVWSYEAAPLGAGGEPLDLPASIAKVLADIGIDPDAHRGFAASVEPIVATGRPFWVAPGTSSWCSLIGRVDNAVANLVDAAATGLAEGATGYLIADWGDGGHLQPPSVSFGPLIFGGAVSWCLAANRDLDLPDVLDRWVFGEPPTTPSLGGTLDELGRMWRRTGMKAFNGSPLQAGLVVDSALMVMGEPDAAKVAATVERLDAALDTLAASDPTAADGPVVRQELTSAVRLARHGAYRLLDRAGGPAPDRDGLRTDLAEAIELQSAAWLARSRPGGLPDSLAHLQATLATYG
jgi:hypothetical protein